MVPIIESGPMFAGVGTFQFKKFAAAFPRIKNFRHAVDVGAHCGIWTRVLSQCFGLVSAFEPNRECEECFWLNNPRGDIRLYSYALGHASGTATLNTKLGSSTAFTRVDPHGDIEVSVRTLDSFELEQVDFIKIDVEGWEEPVVVGGAETIQRWKPTMIVEQKPGNAERHGLTQFGAVKLLEKMGAKKIADISGDVIMAF